MAAFFVLFLVLAILGIVCFPVCVYFFYNYGLFVSMTAGKLKYFLYYVVVFYTLVAIYSYIYTLYLVFR